MMMALLTFMYFLLAALFNVQFLSGSGKKFGNNSEFSKFTFLVFFIKTKKKKQFKVPYNILWFITMYGCSTASHIHSHLFLI